MAPSGPWHYVDPTVKYDGKRQLTVELGLSTRLAGSPAGWPAHQRGLGGIERSPPDRHHGAGKRAQRKGKRLSGQLEADVYRDPNKQAEVRLNVDGYPRGIRLQVPLDGPQEKELDDRQSDLEGIEIVQPTQGTLLQAARQQTDIKVQVTAPRLTSGVFDRASAIGSWWASTRPMAEPSTFDRLDLRIVSTSLRSTKSAPMAACR